MLLLALLLVASAAGAIRAVPLRVAPRDDVIIRHDGPLRTSAEIREGDEAPSYDHQTATYWPNFAPVAVGNGSFTVVPFFSPSGALPTTVQLIEEAQTSIRLMVPDFSSWSGCAYSGCTVEKQRNEEDFPVFNALLNALHRGVKVTLLTNDYETDPSNGELISPATFLQAAGVDVRYFATVTFMHSKVVHVDADEETEKLAVSSVNFSKSSMIQNREAGVLLYGRDAGDIFTFWKDVFQHDIDLAYTRAMPLYSSEDMQIILDTSPLDVTLPEIGKFDGAYLPTPSPVDETDLDVTIFTSPDFAMQELKDYLDVARDNIQLFIYQINSMELARQLVYVASQNVTVDILVSWNIYSEGDYNTSQPCYELLAATRNVNLFMTAKEVFNYSHQKFWILDNNIVMVATGNWAPTDYPVIPPVSFPPHFQDGWRKANRDFTVVMQGGSGRVQSQYVEVFKRDMEMATPWKAWDGTPPKPYGGW